MEEHCAVAGAHNVLSEFWTPTMTSSRGCARPQKLEWARKIPFQGDNGGVSRLQARRGRAGVVLAVGSG